tara:strand:- start:150 stop:644 length:495 start_codon:yes stop_codon:yes gene_type:complete
MKLEAFEYNLRHKTVPFAQNIVLRSGYHSPTVLTYDKNGVEKISRLNELFSYENKDVLFKILARYLNDVEAVAYVLICESYMKKVSKEKYENSTAEEIERIHNNIDDSKECLTITWEYKHEINKGGIISSPILKDNGSVQIDYENILDSYDDEVGSKGRATNLI